MITTKTRDRDLTAETVRAAKGLTRRTLVKGAVAAGTVLGAGPWIVRDAFSSSGELTIMMWSDYLPRRITKVFERATGIKVKQISYGSNDELLNRMKATRGRGVDLISPTFMEMGRWRSLGLLRPWDMDRVPTSGIEPAMLGRSMVATTWEGRNYYLPFVWGTEGLAWRTDKWSPDGGDLTYGDLWRPELKGKVMGRPHSMMLCIGLYLDRIGKLSSNRMMDTYENEDRMRSVWDAVVAFAVEHKPWLKQFWKDANGQINGFRQNGVVLGQTWDGPPTRLRNKGEPIAYRAPAEGALAWIDGLSMPVGATNIDQVYEFLKFQFTPRQGARLANETGYASCAVGADKFLNAKMKRKLEEAYPNDALDNLWWWPLEEPWHVATRAEYRDKFVAA